MSSKLKYTYKIVVGDWSDDGHGKCAYHLFRSSHPIDEIRKAYDQTVDQIKVALHGSDDRGRQLPKDIICVCTDYEERRIPTEALNRFKSIGIDLVEILSKEGVEDIPAEDDGRYINHSDILVVFLTMVKAQIPGFEYERVKDEIECINGHYAPGFNHQFGYGLFT